MFLHRQISFFSQSALIAFFAWPLPLYSQTIELQQLQQAYPEQIKSANSDFILWSDGTKMSLGTLHTRIDKKLNSTSLADQLIDVHYPTHFSAEKPSTDPGRYRYQPFFLKMYGESSTKRISKLTTIYWLPKFFRYQYPLQVTTTNAIDKKLSLISDELEKLVQHHPEFLKYLAAPGGAYKQRMIANTQRLSTHSFGISIDINSKEANYWQWDLEKHQMMIDERTKLSYKNTIPPAIVAIFEKYGFIWGGKWYHYDTQHFEYRPELLDIKNR